MTKDEALKLALEALESGVDTQIGRVAWTEYDSCLIADAITAIKAALAQPAPVQGEPVIAGALFDFMGWLTSREERLVLSSSDEASPAVNAIRDFAKMRGLSLDDAKVQDWHIAPPAAQPEQEPVAMYEDWYNTKSCGHCGMVGGHAKSCRHYTISSERTWVGKAGERDKLVRNKD